MVVCKRYSPTHGRVHDQSVPGVEMGFYGGGFDRFGLCHHRLPRSGAAHLPCMGHRGDEHLRCVHDFHRGDRGEKHDS